MNLNTDCWYILFNEIKVKIFISLSSKRFYTDPPTIPKYYCFDKLNLLKEYIPYHKPQSRYNIAYCHNIGFTNTGICQHIAKKGSIECMEWARKQNYDWHERVCIIAGRCGHLDLLKWLRDTNTCG